MRAKFIKRCKGPILHKFRIGLEITNGDDVFNRVLLFQMPFCLC